MMPGMPQDPLSLSPETQQGLSHLVDRFRMRGLPPSMGIQTGGVHQAPPRAPQKPVVAATNVIKPGKQYTIPQPKVVTNPPSSLVATSQPAPYIPTYQAEQARAAQPALPDRAPARQVNGIMGASPMKLALWVGAGILLAKFFKKR